MAEQRNRLARELDAQKETEDREHSVRQWQPAQTLPTPTPMDGFKFRWVRVAMLGQADPKNLSSKLREGYEPVTISEQPQFRLLVDPDSRFKDNIEIGGLLLCKIPEEFLKQKEAHYKNVNRAQSEAVDNNLMRQNDSRMPLFKESRSTTSVPRSFGKGN